MLDAPLPAPMKDPTTPPADAAMMLSEMVLKEVR